MRTPRKTEAGNAGTGGVAAGSISSIETEKGELRLRGYAIAELHDHSTFTEVCWLLWKGELPSAAELERFETRMRASRALPTEIGFLIQGLAHRAEPMAALRTLVSALSLAGEGGPLDAALRLTAGVPSAIAAHARIRAGMPMLPPDPELGLAAGFLHMLTGRRPGEEEAGIFDACLILCAEQGLDASTRAARATASGHSDLHSAVTSAVAALPPHGGADKALMSLLTEIGTEEEVGTWMDAALSGGGKVLGPGHWNRMGRDPRSPLLREGCRRLGQLHGDLKWFSLSARMVEELRKRRGPVLDLDFHSAAAFHYLEIPADLHTPVFAMGHLPGWIAHVLEQQAREGLPEAGSKAPRSYRPIEER